MGRLLLALVVGLVGALIVHIGVIFAMPRLAEDNAWARLSGWIEPFHAGIVSEGVPPGGGAVARNRRFTFMDPAFAVGACRFSLSRGPVRLFAEPMDGFWSASIVSRSGDNLYSINERLAFDGRFDLVVGTASQFEQARIEGLIDSDDTAIPVAVTSNDMFLTLRALLDHESERPLVERFMRSLRCEPIDLSAELPSETPSRAG